MPKKRRDDPYVTGVTMTRDEARAHAILVANNLAVEGGRGEYVHTSKENVEDAVYLAMCRALGIDTSHSDPTLSTRSSVVVQEWEYKLVYAAPSPGKNFPEKKQRRDIRTGMLVAIRWVLGHDVNLVKWLNVYTGTKR
jgi:hypothetical protein